MGKRQIKSSSEISPEDKIIIVDELGLIREYKLLEKKNEKLILKGSKTETVEKDTFNKYAKYHYENEGLNSMGIYIKD